ncbi:hypothetical protein PN296_05965 [Peptostreptococcus anaerobius]|uniref:hypothetical protein n=1 Tax=Peptostreptococcus anaerobius TaxID=1261 RepID=UPI00232D0CE8|nr:hypothetical protein [Peptostreptococcus anaerobius]MDB8821765.1 hypothetical protein [Peptostreptococcus anaerobius]MDB8826394.1 hypothetical protein [Peptostreptococcus anaerobius]MDB8828193.1 hypothetical protein [Peptostreptococcus anaerobius]MDB8829940.1 hypothetical protein [Peptostreptococcus anaerobius]MDB8831871.1 hypothetical protein [Peptostreptococcus anaerobius]
MSNIKVWDKKEKLKGLDPQVWLEAYPRAKSDTLVLVDDTVVYFLEDIKSQGFTGATDTAVVEAFLNKKEEDRQKAEKEAKAQADHEKSEMEKRVEEEVNKVRLEYAVAVAELTEKIEKDKLELSTAIVEAIEMKAGGTV